MHKLLVSALLAASLTGCGLIYKVDVYQGNLLDPDAVAQVKPGLTKRQVHSLLGTPSVEDPFHSSRWDYISTISRRGAATDVRNLTLVFDGDVLASVEGDYLENDDLALYRHISRYGNLPRDKKKSQQR
ncbi:outer membrane protein assembly factor BamE [Xanthomonadaceae bacterium JHOS43]|nr:outer membrane protein assembly factor BamE [Xanthomonadaceae bacterium JHOS43]MCX7564210.1 outer membrane protein assembly factor BamE [Xanthomonadaceae bacterium XH05]